MIQAQSTNSCQLWEMNCGGVCRHKPRFKCGHGEATSEPNNCNCRFATNTNSCNNRLDDVQVEAQQNNNKMFFLLALNKQTWWFDLEQTFIILAVSLQSKETHTWNLKNDLQGEMNDRGEKRLVISKPSSTTMRLLLLDDVRSDTNIDVLSICLSLSIHSNSLSFLMHSLFLLQALLLFCREKVSTHMHIEESLWHNAQELFSSAMTSCSPAEFKIVNKLICWTKLHLFVCLQRDVDALKAFTVWSFQTFSQQRWVLPSLSIWLGLLMSWGNCCSATNESFVAGPRAELHQGSLESMMNSLTNCAFCCDTRSPPCQHFHQFDNLTTSKTWLHVFCEQWHVFVVGGPQFCEPLDFFFEHIFVSIERSWMKQEHNCLLFLWDVTHTSMSVQWSKWLVHENALCHFCPLGHDKRMFSPANFWHAKRVLHSPPCVENWVKSTLVS